MAKVAACHCPQCGGVVVWDEDGILKAEGSNTRVNFFGTALRGNCPHKIGKMRKTCNTPYSFVYAGSALTNPVSFAIVTS